MQARKNKGLFRILEDLCMGPANYIFFWRIWSNFTEAVAEPGAIWTFIMEEARILGCRKRSIHDFRRF